jgi:hypothetical protein
MLLLLIAVAFGVDAIVYSGAYSQAAYRAVSSKVQEIEVGGRQNPPEPAR